MALLNLLVLIVLFYSVKANFTKPLDLTHQFDNNTHYWFGSAPFHFTRITEEITPKGFWLSSNDFEAGEHGGTHLDAPYHFFRGGWKVDEIPFNRFFGKGVVINAKEEAAANPDYLLTTDKLVDWEKVNGPIPHGSILLINFGWASKYTDWTAYFGSPKMDITSLHFPGLSEEAAEWIVRSGKVYGVGSDTPSIDAGQSEQFMAHRVLSEHNIYILENVALNQENLPERDFQLVALPMKIKYGTGAPCRVAAVPIFEDSF